MSNQAPLSTEREQTDNSLRAEREVTDQAIGEEQVAVDDVADAVISRARARADELLAAARASTDRKAAGSQHPAAQPQALKRERALEDRVLREERHTADEVLRAERSVHSEALSIGREDTDNDLLRERERSDLDLARRDDFLGIVSHDLRSMLSSIVLSAGLICEESARGESSQATARHAKRIQSSSARMNRLIGDLVDVASIEAGALAVTREAGDLAQVVAEAVDNFQAQAAEKRILLSVEIAAPLPPVSFDPARILQVLANLLSNAVKFTPSGGRIDVRLEQAKGELLCVVSDTGTGIPSDKLETVFERFLQLARNDRRGVGLGLYISKCIVQGHGGRIWAESTPAKGSAFYFTVPYAVAPDPIADEGSRAREA
jgi:signal transduction histidine kinase